MPVGAEKEPVEERNGTLRRLNERMVPKPYAISRPEMISTAIRTPRIRNRWDSAIRNSTVASTTVVRM